MPIKDELLSHISSDLRSMAIDIRQLVPDPANARKHSERNIEAIKNSLAKFGQRRPIVVQKDGMIVRAGNGTLQAAIELEWQYIAVNVIDEPSDLARQYSIADNRTAELAEWDERELVEMLEGFDSQTKEALGFEQQEIDEMILSIMAKQDLDAQDEENNEQVASATTINFPVTIEQEQSIRRAIALAKEKHDTEITGAAVAAIAEEWMRGQ